MSLNISSNNCSEVPTPAFSGFPEILWGPVMRNDPAGHAHDKKIAKALIEHEFDRHAGSAQDFSAASTSSRESLRRVPVSTPPIPISTALMPNTKNNPATEAMNPNTGGAVMGADPATSAVNKYLQSWDVPNVFTVGGSAFPQNSASAPTCTIGALACWAADSIKDRYLKRPDALA